MWRVTWQNVRNRRVRHFHSEDELATNKFQELTWSSKRLCQKLIANLISIHKVRRIWWEPRSALTKVIWTFEYNKQLQPVLLLLYIIHSIILVLYYSFSCLFCEVFSISIIVQILIVRFFIPFNHKSLFAIVCEDHGLDSTNTSLVVH